MNRSYRRILVTGASGGGFGACLDRPRETRRPFAPRIQGFKPLPGAGRASLDSTGMHLLLHSPCDRGAALPKRSSLTEGRVSDQPFASSQRPYRGVRRDNAILRLRQFAYPRAVPVNADRLAQTRSIDCTRKW